MNATGRPKLALPSPNGKPVASRDHEKAELEPQHTESAALELARTHKVYVAILLALLVVAGVAVASTTDIDTLGWMWRAGWWR